MKKTLFKDVKITDYISSLAALIGIIFGIWVINQNTQTIKTAQDSFLLSLPQTLEIMLPSIKDPNFYIKNTNQNAIKNVEVYFVKYLRSRTRHELFYRKKSTSAKDLDRVEPGGKFTISPAEVLDAENSVTDVENEDYNQEIAEGIPYYVVVVVFHRVIDNKRFVNVEPYTKLNLKDEIHPSYSYVYGKKNVGHASIDFSYNVKIIKEMEETEKILFRAD
jgi:hypothetical protein